MIIIRFIKLLFIMGLGYVLFKVLWKGEGLNFFRSKKKKKPASQQANIEEMKKDPVCGTYIPEHEAITHRLKNGTYFFCSEECKETFLKKIKK
ncbi:MAG: YHS domain-containing protein [bacterium]|nr:YHS domain-containing protein [bacterium]